MTVNQPIFLEQGKPAVRQKALVVDGDLLLTGSLEKLLDGEGFVTTGVVSGSEALRKIAEDPPDVVLLDVKLPDSLDGLNVLETIKQTHPETAVIMISSQAEIRSAVNAMKAGAIDFLEKPLDFNRLKAILQQLRSAGQPGPVLSSATDCVFVSERMRKVLEITQRLALKSDITVLMLGESGTGKNYLCRKMHELSPRRHHAYVQIGCSNIPDHLIESELFGYEKGAFTDAKQTKKGLVEVAEGGTLLLDELGEMDYQFQAKILALLEEKRFRKVGALRDSFADVRILAATNRNLHTLVQEKKFRLDLYYRLNVATIDLPPLRERPEDIPPLLQHFLIGFSQKYGDPVKILSESALDLLKKYAWPGNIRQLKNLLERLVVLSDQEVIQADEISSCLLLQPMGPDSHEQVGAEVAAGFSLVEMEERYIRTALKITAGNQRKAAELLKISRDTLRYRLKKMGAAPGSPRICK